MQGKCGTISPVKTDFDLSGFTAQLDGKLVVDGRFQTLEYCTSSCETPFLTFLENPKYLTRMNANVSCLLTTAEIAEELSDYEGGLWIAEEPKKEFVKLHNFLAKDFRYARPEFETVIGKECEISPLAVIASHNVCIGNHVTIGAFVVVNENVTIGNDCVIHENCVLGGKSFNFAKCADGSLLGMIDLGQVILGERVEICPLCHIAGAPLPTDRTVLADNVKLDAMVHVGHGTHVGKDTEIPAGAQIAGNCEIGEGAWIGVNATVSNRIKIGDYARVSLGSVVTRNVDDNQTVTGNFAVDHMRFITELRQRNRNSGGGSRQ